MALEAVIMTRSDAYSRKIPLAAVEHDLEVESGVGGGCL